MSQTGVQHSTRYLGPCHWLDSTDVSVVLNVSAHVPYTNFSTEHIKLIMYYLQLHNTYVTYKFIQLPQTKVSGNSLFQAKFDSKYDH